MPTNLQDRTDSRTQLTHASRGASSLGVRHQSSEEILSGTSGCGDDTALIKSSTTLVPDFLPAASISLTLESASLLASSSAFLLPLVCWNTHQYLADCLAVEGRTSDSNFLNSSSFFFRYSSISFWASDLASFTLFVRSGNNVLGFPFEAAQVHGSHTFSGYIRVSLAFEARG